MMRILLVDDSKVMRSRTRVRLALTGVTPLTIEEAQNGGDALAMLHELQPDWILSSWSMPEMGGVELLLELKARRCDTAFGFVLHEKASEHMRAKAAQAGARFVLEQPVTEAALLAVLLDD